MIDTECIEKSEECRGEVYDRPAPSLSGFSYVRCDHHWGVAYDRVQAVREIFPDSPHAPDWFDPEYAGETWDDEY